MILSKKSRRMLKLLVLNNMLNGLGIVFLLTSINILINCELRSTLYETTNRAKIFFRSAEIANITHKDDILSVLEQTLSAAYDFDK